MRVGIMAKVKAWTNGEVGEPHFPDAFEVVKKAVLQVTDIKTNRNKYYALELHSAQEDGEARFRVYTHYGRTDDLEVNPQAGQKECRYFDAQWEAEACYDSIYRQKTSASKGYKEVSLASSKIGSELARGTGVGEIDARTLERMSQAKGVDGNGVAVAAPAASKLSAGVQDLVRYIYDEATAALTNTVAAKITANGIETPLGILTVGQIEKGEAILAEMYDHFQKKQKNWQHALEQLSGDFYTAVPHRIGRTRAAIADAVINSLEAFEQKQSTLQLMKDMLQVNGEGGSVLFDAKIDKEYEALKCQVGFVDHDNASYREIAEHV